MAAASSIRRLICAQFTVCQIAREGFSITRRAWGRCDSPSALRGDGAHFFPFLAKDGTTIVARLVNACWYIFKLAVGVVLVAGAAIGVYMYVRMDDEVRRYIESMLAEQYPRLNVSVGGARIVEGKGIAVYDVSLADPAATGRNRQLLQVDELMVVCDVELTALVQGCPEVRRVEVKHPQVFLERDASGRWSLAGLVPSKSCGGGVPPILVRDGVLSLGDGVGGAPALALREVQLSINPVGGPAAAGSWPSLRVEGTLGGQHVRRAAIRANVDGPQRRCAGAVEFDRLLLNESLLAWARPYVPAAARATKVTGLVDGSISVDWRVGVAAPQTKATLHLYEGQLADPWLPQPVIELAGTVIVDGAEQRVEQLTGKCGSSTVAASLNRNGWGATAPLGVSARADNVPLDNSLYQALATASRDAVRPAGLPQVLREYWDKFQPTGIVDATLQAGFDGTTWKPTATLTGRQLSFESDKFAYRLSEGAGTIKFTPRDGPAAALLEVNLVGQGGGQPIALVGRVEDPRPLAAGWLDIIGKDIELEKRMIDALEPKAREVIASLNPAGKLNVHWRIERPAIGAEPQTTLTLDLTDMRIIYDKFPYPLRHIRGTLAADGNNWKFTNLVSVGRPTVRGEGYLRPVPEGSELSFWVTAEAAPLNEDLFEALPPSVQQLWQQLQPRGEIDLRSDVFYRTGQLAPSVAVTIRPRPESAQLRPVFFPYLMEQVTGAIGFKDGQASLADFQAQHDRTTIRTNGNGYFAPDGRWQMRLSGLTVDRLAPAQDLLSALPRPLGKLIERLQPTGNFSLSNGVLDFRKSASAIAPMESEWDVQLDCHQADLRCGVDLQNIHGSVRFRGQSNGERTESTGDLALESVTFQEVQFTDVKGPLWVDEKQCLLGRWATDQQRQAARHLTGRAYGGAVTADAWVSFESLPNYSAEATLAGADLNRLLLERSGGQHNLGGKLDADLRLKGNGYKVESLIGDGHIHVRDANIGELPILVSLLKVLRTGSQNKSAFNQSEIDFRVQGRHITLDKIDFLGDAVNLYGQGMTDLDQRLNLVFSPSVARNDSFFPLVKTLVGQANQQIMQMYVTGTFAKPEVTREAFPKINQMLQQVRQDLEDPVGVAERQAQRGIAIGEPARQ